MSVFLRWGIFGILGVAALLYAYNASKRMAERHAQPAPPAVEVARNAVPPADQPPASGHEAVLAPSPPIEHGPSTPARCERELLIAQRAIEARRSGEPLDRLLRIQEIAFESSPQQRARLEKVATRYFNYASEFQPAALRIAVISDCESSSP